MSALDRYWMAPMVPTLVTLSEPSYHHLHENMRAFASTLPRTVFVPRHLLDRFLAKDPFLWQERNQQSKGEQETLRLMESVGFDPTAVGDIWLAGMIHSLRAGHGPVGWSHRGRRFLAEMTVQYRNAWHHLSRSTYPGAGYLADYFQEPEREDDVRIMSEYESAMVCATHVIVRYQLSTELESR